MVFDRCVTEAVGSVLRRGEVQMKTARSKGVGAWAVVVLALVLGFGAGCSDETKITNKTEWLCEHDQIEQVDPDLVPEGQQLSDYIDPGELEYYDEYLEILEETEAGPQRDAGVQLEWVGDDAELTDSDRQRHLQRVRRLVAELQAERASCWIQEVQVDDEQPRAQVQLSHTVPAFDETLQVDPDTSREDVERHLDEHRRDQRFRTTLEFVDTDEGWRAYPGIEQAYLELSREHVARQLQQLRDELPRQRRRLQRDQQHVTVARLRVLSASVHLREWSGRLDVQLQVDVQNDTGEEISGADFDVTIRLPDQPNIETQFTYSQPRPLRPGETDTWELTPASEADLRVDELPDAGATARVRPVRLHGRAGRLIAEADRNRGLAEPLVPPRREIEQLEDEIEQLEQRKQSLDERIEQSRLAEGR